MEHLQSISPPTPKTKMSCSVISGTNAQETSIPHNIPHTTYPTQHTPHNIPHATYPIQHTPRRDVCE